MKPGNLRSAQGANSCGHYCPEDENLNNQSVSSLHETLFICALAQMNARLSFPPRNIGYHI